MRRLGSKYAAVLAAGAIFALALNTTDSVAQSSSASAAGAGGASADSLANAAQNPLATTISLPLQYNGNFGIGPDDETQSVINIQPVIPFDLGAIGLDDWNLINRVIFPLVYQPDLGTGSGSTFGLGDTQYSAFFSPDPTGSWVFGAGPIIQFPTATDPVLGSQQWGFGPTAVAVYSAHPIIAGGLVNNVWGLERGDAEGTSVMTVQPFFNYNFDGGWYATTSPVITANWNADADDVWTVPVGGGFGRIFRIGEQPINAQLSAYYNVVAPDQGPDWQLRFQFTFLFPG